jgi:hypothetical protein
MLENWAEENGPDYVLIDLIELCEAADFSLGELGCRCLHLVVEQHRPCSPVRRGVPSGCDGGDR